jgi:hypothetical protein
MKCSSGNKISPVAILLICFAIILCKIIIIIIIHNLMVIMTMVVMTIMMIKSIYFLLYVMIILIGSTIIYQFLAGIILKYHLYNEFFSELTVQLKIIIATFQIISSSSNALSVNYPPYFEGFTNIVQVCFYHDEHHHHHHHSFVTNIIITITIITFTMIIIMIIITIIISCN